MANPLRHLLAAVILSGLVAACAPGNELSSGPPVINPGTMTRDELRALPPPAQRLVAAVYNFRDLTGQHKPNDAFPEYSKAVTQGGAAMLVQALQDAGGGAWFNVVEREGLPSLLQERQLVRTNMEQHPQPGRPSPLPPLVNAGLLLEGGIVSYETNTLTGGFGARYLGIGGNVEYRQDTVTVYVRAVSTRTGEILRSITTSKTVFSSGLSGGAFKFIALRKLLEIEAGITVNEPPQLAVRKAIEKAVTGLVVEGAMHNFWNFADPAAGRKIIETYRSEVEGA